MAGVCHTAEIGRLSVPLHGKLYKERLQNQLILIFKLLLKQKKLYLETNTVIGVLLITLLYFSTKLL